MQLVAKGKGSGLTCHLKEAVRARNSIAIAMNLRVSKYTVKNHLSRIMAQLRAESRHQAVDVMRAGGYSLSA
jgi:FixJ family two-component response regulator